MESEGIMEWIKIINPIRCSSSEAWEGKDTSVEAHYSCTEAIAGSDPLIKTIMNKIEEISKLDQVTNENLIEDIWLLFENMTLQEQQRESNDLIKTFAIINELHGKRESDIADKPDCIDIGNCPNDGNCPMHYRKIVLQLKLIQLGYYGPSEATAGLYLANHKEKFGAYFTNSLNNRWPSQPLNYHPNQEEEILNGFMVKLTEAVSNFTNDIHNRLEHKSFELKNISILDLPAFGSRLSHLNQSSTNAPNWPMEVNFAILKKYKYNRTELSTAFRSYKELIQLWATYMDFILEDETSQLRRKFPPDIAEFPSNPFDFTRYIEHDYLTFLQVYMHSYAIVTDNPKMNLVWQKTAERIFGDTLDKRIVHGNGLFDKLFLDCSFKRQFMMAGEPLAGNCDMFQQSLTSNGLCFSFNTNSTPSSIWSDSFSLAKAVEEMGAIKPRNFLNFAGAGANEGKYNNKEVLENSCCLTNDSCFLHEVEKFLINSP